MLLDRVDTPALVLDGARLRRSCEAMRVVAARHGVRLRPHLKTAKCAEVAELALGDGVARGICVATLDEARWLADRGFVDQLYAVGLVPGKVGRVASLVRDGVAIAVVLEGIDNARAVAERAAGEGVVLDVFVEVDSGQGRGGHRPDDPALVEVARVLDAHPATRVAGVLTHAGHSYGAATVDAIARIAEDERAAAVAAAEAIRAASIACPEVSVGSTPTARFAAHLDGVTELRAGVYTFFDLVMRDLGVCQGDELALSVIATVVARRDGAAWIDAGTLSLGAERGPGHAHGEVTAVDGAPLPGAPIVDALNQEHGRVVATDGALEGLEIGARVRVWPHHACITAAMFDRYHVVEDVEVVGVWPRLRG